MITFQDFTYKYPKGTGPTLKNVSLQVNKGEFLLITGCSGAGKTTLCRAMFGALHHDIGGDFTGTLTLNGRDVKEYTIGDIGKFMGVVFDDPESQLFMPLVEDEIKFGLQARNMPAGKDDIKKALDWVGISHLSKRAPHELSGGQKQKVAIAAALSVNPEIILFDEPTSQLDPQSTIEIYEILSRLKAEGKTIVLVEQKIEDIIDKVDKIAVIDQGQVIAYGAPRDVLKSKELYNVMPYPCVSRLAIELKAPEMLLSMEEGQKYLATAGITMKPGRGNGPETDVKGSPLLEVKDLRFAYGGIKVLHDISFKVMPGDVIAVLGHNGCGKTTLLKNVIGLLKPPEKGMVLLGGKDVVDMAVDQAAKMAGFLFQNPDNMLFADTALEEVMFGPTNLGFADAKERSLRAMEEVGLAHKTAEYPRYLGNGEKLRLCVASILAMGPRLIILDEPTTGLDDNECARLMEVVLKLKSEGVAMLIVTHDMNLVAKYADRAIVISNGRIFRDGTPAEVLKDAAAMEAASLKSPSIVVLSSGCGRVCLTVEEFMEALS